MHRDCMLCISLMLKVMRFTERSYAMDYLRERLDLAFDVDFSERVILGSLEG